jgi:hypothetical protein
MATYTSLQNAGFSQHYREIQPKQISAVYLAEFFYGFPQFHKEFSWIISEISLRWQQESRNELKINLKIYLNQNPFWKANSIQIGEDIFHHFMNI